jgi:hypothetical protein
MAGKSKGGREVRKPKHAKTAKTPEVPAVIVKTAGPKKAK